ncbi:siderophore-interacting protein [Aliirhizobium smilacinae]|uniref:Siderophore-interacting protein n=1 Tax=Aliirhizobium smilacinae TaxID=1395944 RepID=A0A5C4XRG2_9HYPH|nr:siderophore-interacting protein [Rhizobium smilacinae]
MIVNAASFPHRDFVLTGTAIPVDADDMLAEICEHFIDHAEVFRDGDHVTLSSEIGEAYISRVSEQLDIRLACSTEDMLSMTRGIIAEHLFMFAGDDPLTLEWADQPKPTRLSNLSEIRIVSAQNVTPRMRRLIVSCADVARFDTTEGLHVRLLMPPKGREPIWPVTLADGRIGWPEGEDEIAVRYYTIRSIDLEHQQMAIDFVLHEDCGKRMPGAEFGLTAQPGDRAALLGPGAGGMPEAKDLLLAGDETALPAIARMIELATPDTKVHAIIEVADKAEEQALTCAAAGFSVEWLHRNGTEPGTAGLLEPAIAARLDKLGPDTFVWAACEKTEAQAIRARLKAHGLDRARMTSITYWRRGHTD